MTDEIWVPASAASSNVLPANWGRFPPPGFIPIQDEYAGIESLGPKARAEVIDKLYHDDKLTCLRSSLTGSGTAVPRRLWGHKPDHSIDYVFRHGAAELIVKEGEKPTPVVIFAKKGCLASIKRVYTGGGGGRPADWVEPFTTWLRGQAEDDPTEFLFLSAEDILYRFEVAHKNEFDGGAKPILPTDRKYLKRIVRKLHASIKDGKTLSVASFSPGSRKRAK